MKKVFSKIIAFLAIGLLFGACEENAIPERTEFVTSGANIRFSHAAQDAPMVNFFLNDLKATTKSATTTGRQTGLAWSATLANTIHPTTYGYVNVPSGSYTLAAVDTTTKPGTTTLNMNKIASSTVKLDENSYYTSYLVGMAGSFEVLTLRDDLPQPNFSVAYVRFVNAMPGIPASTTGAPGSFSVKAIRTAPDTETIDVANNVAFKGESGYVAIKPGTYNLALYLNGSATAYSTFTGGAIVAGRVYTFYTKGNYTSAPGTINRQLLRER